jgi:hypothetical protein
VLAASFLVMQRTAVITTPLNKMRDEIQEFSVNEVILTDNFQIAYPQEY